MLLATPSAFCRTPSQRPGMPSCKLQNAAPPTWDDVLQLAGCSLHYSSPPLHFAERLPGSLGGRPATCRTPSRLPGRSSCSSQGPFPAPRDAALQPAEHLRGVARRPLAPLPSAARALGDMALCSAEHQPGVPGCAPGRGVTRGREGAACSSKHDMAAAPDAAAHVTRPAGIELRATVRHLGGLR